MRLCTIAVFACLFAIPAAPTLAQGPDVYGSRQALFERLSAGQHVRLTAGSGRQEGRLLEYDSGNVVFTSASQPIRLSATTIDTLWTRTGSAGAGAIVGALLGGGLGVLAGTSLGEENAGSAKNVLGMAGLGAIAGSLLGVAIGAPIGRWQRRFP